MSGPVRIPEPDSPEGRLWMAAIDVAAGAPMHRAQYVSSALVPWRRIERLREALDAVGVEWRAGGMA